MKAKQWLKTVLIIIFGMLIIGFVVVPLPYYVESPGATIDLKELITVNDKEDKGSGSFSYLCWYQASYRFLSFKS